MVRLEFDTQRMDKYQRTLAYAYLPDGTFLNAEIVKQGFGHAYTTYPFRYLEQFRRYEGEAREAGRGLWGAAEHAAVVGATSEHEHAANPEELVYLTRTGTKYHRDGCRFLSSSRIPIHLKDVGSHGPCSVCKPPTLTAAARTSTTPSASPAAPPSAPTQPASDGRCLATTKKGTQCSRRAQAGSSYCWQHQR